jgi:predicted esterase
MITLPSEALGGLLTARVAKLKAQGINTYMPESIKQGFYNPTTQQYKGKKILSVHGKLDKLIPFRFAQPKLDEILAQDSSGKDIQQHIQEGKGHAVSPEMVSKAAEWVYIHGFCS